jgi:PAS domain S-box-containing protein
MRGRVIMIRRRAGQSGQPSSQLTTGRTSIRWKFTGFAAALLLLSIVGLSAVIYQAARDGLRNQIHNCLNVVASDRQAMLLSYVSEQQQSVRLIASRTQLRELLARHAAHSIDDRALARDASRILTDAAAGDNHLLGLRIANPSGTVIAATDPQAVGEHLSNNPAFQTGLSAPYFSVPELVADKPSSIVSGPVMSYDRHVLGVVLMTIDVTPMQAFLSNPNGLGKTGEVLVGAPDGDWVRYLFPPRNSQEHAVPKQSLTALRHAMDGKEGFRAADDYRGVEVLAVHRPVGFGGWGLVVKIDATEAYAPIRDFAHWLLTAAAVILIVGLLTAWRVGGRFTWPIIELARVARAVSEGDLKRRVPIRSTDEIGTLEASFNQMTTALAESVETLERRVQERTRELTERECRMREIIESAHDAFVSIDENSVVVEWNAAAEHTFGWSRSEAVGHPLTQLIIPPQFVSGHREGIENFLRTGRGPMLNQHLELQALDRNGRQFPIELSITPVRQQGHWFFHAFLHDISRRKEGECELARARDAAESANRAKSEFVANMSHEIRTPMNGVIGMIELALDTSLNTEQREYLTMAKSSADSLLTLLNDILDFSKIEARKLQLDELPFDFRESLGDTLRVLALRARQKGLELAGRIDPDVPEFLMGDPARLRQVLVNLMGNAIKFTERGEVVADVQVERGGEDEVLLHFRVRDTGIGIPKAKQERIFEAFSQADTSTTRRYGGTGLGLTISGQLVHMMGGEIWVESEEDQGSTFHFTAHFKIPEQPPAPKTRWRPPNLRDLPVLIVDDNDTNRRILQEVISHWGMLPTTATGGREALALIAQAKAEGRHFDLFLLDGHMPEMDGFQLAGEIQRAVPHAPPIIMLTSAGEADDATRCRALGICLRLLKPVKQSELLDGILTAIGMPVEETPAGQAATAAVRTGPLHVLLAEDNLVNQRLATRLLEKQGHSVVIASDGDEACDAFTREPFDLILMDVQMPRVDGLEATRRIRSRERSTGRHIPIIAMTAHAMKGDRERCIEAGMDGYVTKPVDPDQLFNAIQEHAPFVPAPSPPEISGHEKHNGNGNGNGKHESNTPCNGNFDLKSALRTVNGDWDLLHEIVGVFLRESPQLQGQIHQAIAAHDFIQLRAAAHALKGSAASVGGLTVASRAQEIEADAQHAELDKAESDSHELDAALERLTPALRQLQSV